MPKLFIANCTQQIQDFMFSFPGSNKIMKQIIEIGSQIQIPGDLTPAQIQHIVEMHAPYGMVRVDEIDRTKAFIGVCYSIDKRVEVNKIRYALEHNFGVLNERGRATREETAVAVNNSLQNESRDFRAVELEIKELPNKDGKDIEVEEQKIRVDPTAKDTGPVKGGSKRSRAA